MKYVLASASPRRQELLTQAGFSFDVIPSAVKEKITKDIPSDVVMELAYQKALDVYESRIKDNPAYQTEDCIVIGADTIVSYRGEILGKPADNEEAFDYNNVVGLPIARLYHELDSILPKEKIHYAF